MQNMISHSLMQSREGLAGFERKRLEAAARSENLTPAQMHQIEKAAQDYEAVFLSEMLNHMFKDVSFDPMNGEKSSAQDVYKSHLVQEYGKVLASQGGIGLADHLKDQLIDLQTRQNNVSPKAAADSYKEASETQ